MSLYRWRPPVYLKGERDLVFGYEEEFTSLVGWMHCSDTEAANEIFIAGLAAKTQERAEATGLSSKIASFIRRREERQFNIKRLQEVFQKEYASKGADEFIADCLAEGIDRDICDEVLESFIMPELSWREKAINWLVNVCLASGEGKETSTIKREALQANIIIDPEADWNRLRVLASDKGFTGKLRGVWRLPDSE